MKFEIGNKVSIIDENMIGVVVNISAYKAVILDADGFEIEYQLNKLTLISEIDCYETTFNQIPIQKEILKEQNLSKKNVARKVREIDLHFYSLSESKKGMTNHDIVLYQLNAVKKAIQETDKRFYFKVVFIHGIGKGKLRYELEYMLKQRGIKFQDASFRKYGRGAVEILL